MSTGERSSSLTDLARVGFGRLDEADRALDELAATLGLARERVLAGVEGSADPDAALAAILRVGRRREGAVAEAIERAGPTLWRVFGASLGLADFYLRHPEELAFLPADPKELPDAAHMRAELLPVRKASLESVRYAADRVDDKIKFTDDALETILNVPRVFLKTVLMGCVEWARENNVELITAEHMKIINDKRSKEKNKK